MWDHRSLASPPPPDSGGDRSRASENQVSHTPRWFSNHLKPSSLKQLRFFCSSAYGNPPLVDTDKTTQVWRAIGNKKRGLAD